MSLGICLAGASGHHFLRNGWNEDLTDQDSIHAEERVVTKVSARVIRCRRLLENPALLQAREKRLHLSQVHGYVVLYGSANRGI